MQTFELPVSLLPSRLSKAGLNEKIALGSVNTTGPLTAEAMSVARAVNAEQADMETEALVPTNELASVEEEVPVSRRASRTRRTSSSESTVLPPRMPEQQTEQAEMNIETADREECKDDNADSNSSSPSGDVVEIDLNRAPVLESLTLKELKEEAARQKINITGLNRKKEILARLRTGD